MTWTERHNEMLLREILLFESWIQKHGSTERGLVWKRIAESLNQLQEPLFRKFRHFRPTKHCVHCKFRIISKFSAMGT